VLVLRVCGPVYCNGPSSLVCYIPLSPFCAGAVRRFDGAEISDYDEASHTMQGLRMPTAFKFATVGDELTVEVCD
jgi:hypothetical protein